MTPRRVHYLPTPNFRTLICGTTGDIESLQTTQDGSLVDCRRCLEHIGPYVRNPTAFAAYAAGCIAGYGAGYNDGFADGFEEDEDDLE